MKTSIMADHYSVILDGFAERTRRLALFRPLFDLRHRQRYPEYDLQSLGICTLLFILEGMLQGEQGSTYESIAHFLRTLIEAHYGHQLTEDEAIELARFIVGALRNDGRSFEYVYPNFEPSPLESSQEDKEASSDLVVKFHLITYADYDIGDRIVRLKLTSEGLDLLFQTREVHRELRISITQLYLRQQIIKGVFDGALRSVDELRLQVEDLRRELEQLRERIIRDVLEVTRTREHEALFERISSQFERERKVFQELDELVQESLAEFGNKDLDEKEEHAMNQMAKIQQRLSQVINQHDALFTQKLDIQQLISASIESVIVNAFSTKVNFEREILEPAVANNVAIDVLKQVIDPVLPVRVRPTFNPLKALNEQTLPGDEEPLTTEEILRLEQEALAEETRRDQEAQKDREARLETYLRLILTPLVEQPHVRLGEILEQLQTTDPEAFQRLIHSMDFYPFMIQLHQIEAILLRRADEHGAQVIDDLPRVIAKLCEEQPAIRNLDQFVVRGDERVIRLPNGFAISDFLIQRGHIRSSSDDV